MITKADFSSWKELETTQAFFDAIQEYIDNNTEQLIHAHADQHDFIRGAIIGARDVLEFELENANVD